MTVEQIKLITETSKGTRLKHPCTVQYVDGRIEFLKSPFALKDEIKSMKGSRWHGFDEDERKIWSIEDCPRNRFQLAYLKGENPYEWFDRELIQHNYTRPLMPHQRDLADGGLTYHFQIWAAEMGTGKTLSAIEVIEKSGIKEWFYVAPKSVLKAIKREFKKWNLDPTIRVELLTYEAMTRMMDQWPKERKPPMGVIFDESSRLKTATSNRSKAAQMLADLVRYHYDHEGYVILMSGTPSPKTPVDWWSQAEIAYPGFLKEGSPKALEARLAFMVRESYDSGTFDKRVGWKDDEKKCKTCGKFEHEHEFLTEDGEINEDATAHPFKASKNEISLMFERLKGLVIVKHKKDCLNLPDKSYRRIVCKPSSSVLRVAQAIAGTSLNAAGANTLLRELSDGFQYIEKADGKRRCEHCNATGEVKEWVDPNDLDRVYSSVEMMDPEVLATLQETMGTCPACGGDKEVTKYIRETKEIPCPKQTALIDLLEECDEHGRIVVFAGFTGSVDRCVNICLSQEWDVVRCDGRGFTVFRKEKDQIIQVDVDALDYWADMKNNPRVAFVAHPESGGMGLTLTEARMAVFYSNSFKPEFRVQAEDRIHRKGMDENLGCVIVDLIHLPTDDRALTIIRENRTIELMTMGEIKEALASEVLPEGELLEV